MKVTEISFASTTVFLSLTTYGAGFLLAILRLLTTAALAQLTTTRLLRLVKRAT